MTSCLLLSLSQVEGVLCDCGIKRLTHENDKTSFVMFLWYLFVKLSVVEHSFYYIMLSALTAFFWSGMGP